MLTLGLSNDNTALGICNEINRMLFAMPDEMVYEYYMNTIPQTKSWVKWPKKNADSEKKKKEIRVLMEKYKISAVEAKKIMGVE